MRIRTLAALVLGGLMVAAPASAAVAPGHGGPATAAGLGAATTMAAAGPRSAAGTGTTGRGMSGHEHAGDTGDAVRYAALRTCTNKKKEDRPCGPWRLMLHSGKVRELPDARVFPRDGHRKVHKDSPAPIAVSGNGGHIAYVRERDDRLVVRELTGKVHVMPAAALPAKTNMMGLDLALSLDGSTLAVHDGANEKFLWLYDVASGRRLGSLPAGDELLGFSGDEDQVLTRRQTDENTTEIITYDLSGAEATRQVPPQIAAQDVPMALHADGDLVAFYSEGSRALKLFDLRSNAVVNSVRVKLPGGGAPDMVDWTGARQVTLHVLTGDAGNGTMHILQVDPGTGAVRVRDTYRVKNTFVFAACGG
ncbi:hypothetical protein ABZT47_14335 [Sphaerisporangium sp. NPDC005289]|uniref:hypothetical protein n=1 Tax=Sphaerisporangium sp. NPDC005289 TaxID=3155247 RepID=UPI0033A69EE3